MIIVSTTTTIVVDQPPPNSPPYVEPRRGLNVVLTGTDGSTWDIINGPVKLSAGARGFASPDPEHWFKDAPALDGSYWQGMRTPAGDPFLPVRINDDTSAGWRDVDAAFFRALDPARLARLTVTAPDGESRFLRIRYVSGANPEYEMDPLYRRFASYGLTFSADDPFWRGADIQETFEVLADRDFLPGPPFYIMPTSTVYSSRAANPGDVAAWPRWTVSGPLDGFTVGVGASVVTISAALTRSQSITIDMDPRARTIVDQSGADRWLDATTADFAAIPPGANVPLTLDLQTPGAGASILLTFPTRYRRAW